MKAFYLIFAGTVFLLFSGLQWRGVNMDSNHLSARPKYYSYHGSSSGGYYGSRSRGRGYYSHK